MVDAGFYYYVLSGFLLMLLPVVVIGNFYLRGFFWAWFRVRVSQGRKVLIRNRGRVMDTFHVGVITDGMLRFFEGKQGKTFHMPTNVDCVYRAYGVFNIDVDGEKGVIFTLSAQGVSGFDAASFDDQIVKALKKPSPASKAQLFIIVSLVVLFVAVLVAIYFGYKNNQLLVNLRSVPVGAGGF